MKITHNKVGQNLNLTDSSRADKANKNSDIKSAKETNEIKSGLPFSQTSDSVKVDLSPRAQDIQKAKEIAMSSPDVDHAKIEKFQKLIDAGQYKIDAKSIAEKMVDEHLMTASGTSNE